ncbi:unnamed protein product [Strongylus vulgaris]|uniref:Uncharacterized protein n=1 Tax=Strongylus vulgaris TaxID=40348 RepID=A0A3P7IWN8_STRVU|nr:unnamed protein product [Strongylus vulgaris]
MQKNVSLFQEKLLIVQVAGRLLNRGQNTSAGLWAYGYVQQEEPFSVVFDRITDDEGKFSEDANNIMTFGEHLMPSDNDEYV